ncbi:TfoX/Sxy family protein [Hydrogenoanaerobacterium sp.]|uniref:TfoX/Sxy family protein n=1 Tax=Hydrogenoanaerobacterium sp. TaxID=2953763 RepID=UPI00289F0020|nr:TfoX/Sxy family protein [Hydrogenoanaerobacterium sp.]
MGELSKLPNIGKVVEEQLNEVGIETAEQLKNTGSKQAWLNIKAIDPSACLNRLCGLEGAIRGIRWHDLPDDVKKELKEFYRTLG